VVALLRSIATGFSSGCCKIKKNKKEEIREKPWKA
jgi:hypothetical protein